MSSEIPTKKKKDKNNKKNVMFPNYWSPNEVEKGLQNGELIKGILRINPKNYKEAYVSNKDRSKQDYVIESLLDRNRALEGDVVALKLKSEDEWKEKQQTAVVVYILEMVHPRKAVGYIRVQHKNKNKIQALFCPRDNRIPRMEIDPIYWPPLFTKDPSRYEETLFLAKIILWVNVNFAVGVILKNVGTSFNLVVETTALLLENELDVSPFPPEALQHVPKQTDISEEDLSYRKDLRNECIFTIDPLTARDLDDAVSCKELENGNYLVGVHISDVAHYLKEATILDTIVSQKATSIYLVDNVFHMLPTEMCMHCSLLPGKDKLSFSVLWEMTSEGEILKTEYTRSVINSCAQLAYEHAQKIIENPDDEISDDGTPKIHNGFEWNDLKKVVTALYEISLNLRRKRFENGALQINQPKMVFRLDPTSMVPTEWFVYENKEAHRLIEEFMLLANISVAKKLVQNYPDIAFLRCHDPPTRHMLEDLQKTMKAVDVHLDISSSGDIQSSLRAHTSNDYAGMAKMVVLNHLLAKPMTRARYFCSEDGQDPAEFYHYALSIPLYTHFTSPIRRYADIIVHRLLAATLGYTEKPQWERESVVKLAANCNKQKYNAKRAGEASCDLFFAHYVETHQPFIQDAVVCDVKDRSFDVIVIATGTNVRIYEDSFDEKVTWTFTEEHSKKQISIRYPETQEEEEFTYVIKIFTIVKVALKRKPKTHKLEGTLLKPINKIVVHRSY
ncbi:DIS3-like exonuclease 2 isoform X2 [Agrilus planipennis]|uniref:DIS3-like exonuclease 2 isoform X2 n=1 Tax=Agrilus planipennis TaxID=224129 RepID=A0A1W4WV58_AGRPL|nr:DIS3-like exonuclease 2 isoform X2 [Agrilus planipennis]